MHIDLKSITCECGCIYTCPKSHNKIVNEYDEMRGNKQKFYAKVNEVDKKDGTKIIRLLCPKCDKLGYQTELKNIPNIEGDN